MKILVTGVAGMIGSNLARALIKDGHSVVGVDNFWRGKRDTVRHLVDLAGNKLEFIEADLRDPSSLYSVLNHVHHVFHLADIVGGINFVFSNEFFVWRENLKINASVLEQTTELAPGAGLTYVGSACGYPQHLTKYNRNPEALAESDAYPANPESAYGWSKLMGELEISFAEKALGLSAAVLRLDNVYGYPTELDSSRSQVIPALIRKAVEYPRNPFEVWGSGKQRRSFIHVDDVVQALVQTLTKGQGAGPINIGPGVSTSIGEIAWMIAKISGKDIMPIFDPSKPEGDTDRFSDLTKARAVLGWNPTVDLQQGLSTLYRQIKAELA